MWSREIPVIDFATKANSWTYEIKDSMEEK